MKLTPRKDIDALRADALARLDIAHAARRPASINDGLYAAKRAAALHVLAGGSSPLVATPDEARVILDKAAASDAAIATLEAQRQAAQADIRAAADWFQLQSAIARHL